MTLVFKREMGLETQQVSSLHIFERLTSLGSSWQISITVGLTSRVSIGELVATQVLTNTSVPALRAIRDPTVRLVSGPGGMRSLC